MINKQFNLNISVNWAFKGDDTLEIPKHVELALIEKTNDIICEEFDLSKLPTTIKLEDYVLVNDADRELSTFVGNLTINTQTQNETK